MRFGDVDAARSYRRRGNVISFCGEKVVGNDEAQFETKKEKEIFYANWTTRETYRRLEGLQQPVQIIKVNCKEY